MLCLTCSVSLSLTLYSTGTNSLNQYRSYYTSNDAPSVNYDVAHLMTGIQEGGVAYVNTVCTTSGYNVGVSSLRGQWQGTTSGTIAYTSQHTLVSEYSQCTGSYCVLDLALCYRFQRIHMGS